MAIITATCFGRDPVHIWLIHGTPIAADCIGAILDGFAARGIEFVSLDEAMADPMNNQQPLVTRQFRNQMTEMGRGEGRADRGLPACDPSGPT